MATQADRPDRPPAVLTVVITRTGGFAGLRREWSASSTSATVIEQWGALIEACPWHDGWRGRPGGELPSTPPQPTEPPPAPTMPDRFTYDVRVVASAETTRSRSERVAEPDFTGPWLALLDAVKNAPADA